MTVESKGSEPAAAETGFAQDTRQNPTLGGVFTDY